MANYLVKNGVIIQSGAGGNVTTDYVDTAVETMGASLQSRIDKKTSFKDVERMLSGMGGLKMSIVDNLPISAISTSTVYLIKNSGSTNTYVQWMYIDGNWANIGDTRLDLTNFSTVATTGNYNDINNRPLVNGAEATNSTNIFAPISKGTDNNILKSDGTSVPKWNSIFDIMKAEPSLLETSVSSSSVVAGSIANSCKVVKFQVPTPAPWKSMGATTSNVTATANRIRIMNTGGANVDGYELNDNVASYTTITVKEVSDSSVTIWLSTSYNGSDVFVNTTTNTMCAIDFGQGLNITFTP